MTSPTATAQPAGSSAARSDPDRELLREVRSSALLLGASGGLCGLTLAVERLLAAIG